MDWMLEARLKDVSPEGTTRYFRGYNKAAFLLGEQWESRCIISTLRRRKRKGSRATTVQSHPIFLPRVLDHAMPSQHDPVCGCIAGRDGAPGVMERYLAMLGLGAVSYQSPGAYSPGAASHCPSAGELFDAFDLRCAKLAKPPVAT